MEEFTRPLDIRYTGAEVDIVVTQADKRTMYRAPTDESGREVLALALA